MGTLKKLAVYILTVCLCLEIVRYPVTDMSVQAAAAPAQPGISLKTTAGSTPDSSLTPEEKFGAEYPGLQALADNGSIGLIFREKSVKDTITLGSFRMASNIWNVDVMDEKEDLEWEILEYSEDGKSAFVISKYVVIRQQYNKNGGKTTWEKCSLRKWLNDEFINTAFSDSEKALIKTVTVKTENNSDYKTKGGKDTQDRIFILSKPEADKYYLPENADKKTDYDDMALNSRICTIKNGARINWCLRTPGYSQDQHMSVDSDGTISYNDKTNIYFGVRPVFWIELTPDIIKANKLSIGKDNPSKEADVSITFGNYDYPDSDGNSDGKPEKIEWQICGYDEKENRVLLISRYFVGNMKYLNYGDDNRWESSDIRRWLNTVFYKAAFSDDEAARVKITEINDPEIKTKDKVFLLSKEEAEEYLKYDEIWKAEYTDGDVDSWWLRSPGWTYHAVYSASGRGLFDDYSEVWFEMGVRPAIYLDLELELSAKDIVPEKPVLKSAGPTSDNTGIVLTMDRNFDTDGYEVFLKKPGNAKFEKVAAIQKDGTACRSCTVRNLVPGEYTLRVRAYREYENEKIFGQYSEKIKVNLEGFAEDGYLEMNYPELKKLAETGIIGFNVEYDRDTVKFGSWNKNELEWEVLEYSEDGKSALIMSKNLIDSRKYNDRDESVTWENCSLRKWLNGDFYDGAFSPDEKTLVLISKVVNEDNPEEETEGGNDTEDKVFIPSYSEFLKYVDDNKNNKYPDRRLVPYTDGEIGSYWLRTVGREGNTLDTSDWDEEDWEDFWEDYGEDYEDEDYMAGYTAYVYGYDGYPDLEGAGVAYVPLGVRPVIRIALTDEMIAENNLSVGENKKLSQLFINFGALEKDTGSETIEWQILEYDKKNNRALLLSRYLLAGNQYNDFGNVISDSQTVTWAKSSIRKWLNDDFYGSAFTGPEQALIKKTKVTNSDNPGTKTKGGKNTKDKIFLLSIAEIQKYFVPKELEKDSAGRIGRYKDGRMSEWWLRSPGIGKAGKKTGSASYVDENGGVYGNYYAGNNAGIRPALWIKLK